MNDITEQLAAALETIAQELTNEIETYRTPHYDAARRRYDRDMAAVREAFALLAEYRARVQP